MDQLKVVLAYKFWILAGLAVLVPPVGWWMGTGALAEGYTADVKGIESDVDSVKKLSTDKSYANKQWVASAKQINQKAAAIVTQSHERLFNHERPVMTWPTMVERQMKEGKIKYRGLVPDNLRRIYALSYEGDWQDIRKILDPYNLSTGDGKVLIISDLEGGSTALGSTRPAGVIPRGPVEDWNRSLPPTVEQMWDEQEDLWLLKCVFDAIKRVNEGATDIENARIKRLDEITLRGGMPSDLAARKSGSATAQQAVPGAPSPKGMQFRGTSQSTQKSQFRAPLPYDPDDDFGSDGSKVAANDVNEKGHGLKAQGTQGGQRYVDTAAGKWRSRGFVLRLVMDEREILSLLGELSESPFPVEIRHVEDAHYEPEANTTQNATQQPMGGSALALTTAADQETQHKALQRIRTALNQNYLASVTVVGTFTIYDEPAKKEGTESPKSPPGPLASSAATKPTTSPSPAAPKANTGPSKPGANAIPAKAPAPAAAAGRVTSSPPAGAKASAQSAAKPVSGTPATGGQTSRPTSIEKTKATRSTSNATGKTAG